MSVSFVIGFLSLVLAAVLVRRPDYQLPLVFVWVYVGVSWLMQAGAL